MLLDKDDREIMLFYKSVPTSDIFQSQLTIILFECMTKIYIYLSIDYRFLHKTL